MRTIKIAQIGINRYSHAKPIFDTLLRRSDLFEFAGLAFVEDEQEALQEHLPNYTGCPILTLEQILQDPTIEAVAVETDEIHLTKYAQLAAEQGKHIHMEKPGGRELPAFEKLVETVKQSGKVFHTGYMYRYNPYIVDLMQKVEQGDLGEIFSVEAHMDCLHPAATRQWLEQLPGGMMFYLGCHLVDLIYRLQGEPTEIHALNRSTGIDGVTAEDYGMAVLEYPNGVSFAKTCATEVGGYARRQLVVTGSKGTVEIRPLELTAGGGYMLFSERIEQFDPKAGWNHRGTASTSNPFDRYDAMMAAFAAMVRGEKENPYSPDYELSLYRLVLRCCGVAL